MASGLSLTSTPPPQLTPLKGAIALPKLPESPQNATSTEPEKPLSHVTTLPSSIESEAVRAAKRAERQQLSPALQWLKRGSMLLLGVSLVLWGLSSLDLNLNSPLLQTLGYENTGQRYSALYEKSRLLSATNAGLQSRIDKRETQIQTAVYSEKDEILTQITAGQTQWFDAPGSSDITTFGLYDAPLRALHYFNSRSHEDPILLSASTVKLLGALYTPEKAAFEFEVSHVLGSVFYLATALSEMLDGFPFWQVQPLDTFTRRADTTGDDIMQFRVELERTPPTPTMEEVNPAFITYLQWLRGGESKQQATPAQ